MRRELTLDDAVPVAPGRLRRDLSGPLIRRVLDNVRTEIRGEVAYALDLAAASPAEPLNSPGKP